MASIKDKLRQEGLIKQSVAAARLYYQTLEKLASKCRNPKLQDVFLFSVGKRHG
jgi:hypothetical protein